MEVSDYLFGDIRQYISDTDVSIPGTTPSEVKLTAQLDRRKKRQLPVIYGLVAIILIGGGLLIGQHLAGMGKNETSADAGNLVLAGPPDAGIPDAGPPPSDPGLAPADPGPPDAGPAPAADQKPRRVAERRKKRRRNKPVKVAKVEPKKPPDPPKLPPGKLRLITNPWTDVYHQGRKLGQTPLVDVQLPAGPVKLRVVNREAGIDRVITVRIKSGGKVVKRFNLF
jgi:serine/threonine-protein kinase